MDKSTNSPSAKTIVFRNIVLLVGTMIVDCLLVIVFAKLGIPVLAYVALGISAFLIVFAVKNIIFTIAGKIAGERLERELKKKE